MLFIFYIHQHLRGNIYFRYTAKKTTHTHTQQSCFFKCSTVSICCNSIYRQIIKVGPSSRNTSHSLKETLLFLSSFHLLPLSPYLRFILPSLSFALKNFIPFITLSSPMFVSHYILCVQRSRGRGGIAVGQRFISETSPIILSLSTLSSGKPWPPAPTFLIPVCP